MDRKPPNNHVTVNLAMPPPLPPKNRRSSITAMITEQIPSFNPLGRRSLDVVAPASATRHIFPRDKRSLDNMLTPAAGSSTTFNATATSTLRADAKSTTNSKARTGRSQIPTPISTRPKVRSSSAVRELPVEKPSGQSGQRKPAPTTSAAVDNRRGILKTATSVMNKATLPTKRSTSNLATAGRTTTMTTGRRGKTLTRATSMESFGWFNSTTCGTPGNTRRLLTLNLSTTKKPAFRAVSDNGSSGDREENIQKVLKIPPPTERKQLNRIVFAILDLLGDFEYPNRMSVSEFNAISGATYFSICEFVLQPIKYEKFRGTKVEELVPQLFEVADLMQFPGTLNKYSFKSINLPQGRPAAITLLFWLACRVAAICTPRSFGSKTHSVGNLRADTELNFTGLMLDSYKRMFLRYDKKLDVELEIEQQAYRTTIMDIYMFGQNETLDSLKEALKKLEEELAIAENIEDPDREVVADIEKCDAKKTEVTAKQADVRALIQKYKNIEQFSSQKEMLAKRIQHEEEFCAELANRVAQQPVSVQGLEAISREIETMKKQKVALVQVITGMKQKLAIRNQTSNNAGGVFYKLCEKFRIIDDFNDQLSAFENLGVVGNMEKAKRNPFNHIEFDSWLKDLRRVVRHADRIMSELKLNIEHNWKYDASKKKLGYEEDIERYKRQVIAAEAEFERLKEMGLRERSQLKLLVGAREQEKHEALKVIHKLQTDLDLQKQEIEKLEESLRSSTDRNEQLAQEVKESDTKVEDGYHEVREKKVKMIAEHVETIKSISKEHKDRHEAERKKIWEGVVPTVGATSTTVIVPAPEQPDSTGEGIA